MTNKPNQSDTPKTDAFARSVGKILADNRRRLDIQAGLLKSLIDEQVKPLERELSEAKKEIALTNLRIAEILARKPRGGRKT